MEVTFEGGPKAGETLRVITCPDAFEFPLIGKNGSINSTARYERIKNTSHYQFVGKKDATEAIPAPPEKSVVIKRAKPVSHKHIDNGHLEYDSKKGRYVVKETKQEDGK